MSSIPGVGMPRAQWWQIASALGTLAFGPLTLWLTWSKLRTDRVLQAPVFELEVRRWQNTPGVDLGLTVRNRAHDRVAVRMLTVNRPAGSVFKDDRPTPPRNVLPIFFDVEPGEVKTTWVKVMSPADAERALKPFASKERAEPTFEAFTLRVQFTRRTSPTRQRHKTLKAR